MLLLIKSYFFILDIASVAIITSEVDMDYLGLKKMDEDDSISFYRFSCTKII